MASKDFIIKRDEWEFVSDDELRYYNDDLQFGVICFVDLHLQTVKFGLYSTTYKYDCDYYYDCLPRFSDDKPRFTPCLSEHRLSDYFFKNGTIKYVHIPNEVIETVISWNEDEADEFSLAYEFCEFAEEHNLKTDDFNSLRTNVGAWLCRTTPGGMSYGFGNIPKWRIDEVTSYVIESGYLSNVA